MEQVGTIQVDYDIFSTRPATITVADTSDWIYSENLPSYILITVPGSKTAKSFTFKKHTLNIFNSNNLGLSCFSGNCKEEYVDLPDGIYTVCVKSGYDNIETTKFYLKTDKFELEYSKLLVKYGFEFQDDLFLERAIFIKGLLEVAKSHAKLGDFDKASRYFNEVTKMLNDFITCKDCHKSSYKNATFRNR